MPSSIARSLVVIAALLGHACEASKDSPMVALVESDGYEEAWEHYLSFTRPGPDGSVIAEGDLHFDSTDELRAHFDQRMLEDVDKAHAFQQQSTGYIPKYGWPAQRNIRYCVSNAFAPDKTTWVTRMADAARAWEKVTNVRFVYLSAFDSACTAAQGGVDFAVIRGDNKNGYFACNKMLWDELDLAAQCPTAQAKGVLEIDTVLDVTVAGEFPNMTPTGFLRHELGHILGLRHEHPWRALWDISCDEKPVESTLDLAGVQLTDVAYDRYSVMHYPFFYTVGGIMNACGGDPQSSYSLTKVDVASIHRLYGMHPGWVTSAVNAVSLL